jgi:L-rhamnose-H+ transport protein
LFEPHKLEQGTGVAGSRILGKGLMHGIATILILLGGVMEGLFTLPVKLTPKWAWENTWGSGSLAALILVPLPLLLWTIPHFSQVYSASPGGAIVLVAVFGSGWGLGGIFFGLGVSELGLSLGTSSIMGIIAITGSIVPLMAQRSGHLSGKSSAALLAGICTMLAGLAVCARAGNLKLPSQSRANAAGASFARGAVYCLAAGLLSALVNFALIFGAPLAQAAKDRGVPDTAVNNAIWAIVFVANYLVNLGYCIYLALKRGTMMRVTLPGTGYYWLLAVGMGVLWAGGIVVYGLGASMEGVYGPVLAFPMMLIVSILTANLTGALLGEWRGAVKAARRTMQLGVVIMVFAVVLLGCASWFAQ